MRRFPAWLLTLLVLAPATVARAADAPPKGEVTKYTFSASKIFPGTVRDYWVYVPKQYDAKKPACVHVNQDGIQFGAPAVFDWLIGGADFDTLFATCGDRVYKRKLKVKGANAFEAPIKPAPPRL